MPINNIAPLLLSSAFIFVQILLKLLTLERCLNAIWDPYDVDFL